ncbi:MAG: hypothetical protein ABW352_20565 [Polyangiales bacterium]
MTKRAFLLCSLLALCLLAVAGCSDVESCLEVNEPGCLYSPVRTTGSPCLFDLVPVDGICRKSNDTTQTPCGECEAGALCDEATNTCINFCDMPALLPGGVKAPEAIFCEAIATPSMPSPAMLGFEEVCRRRCRLNCQRLSQFCTGYQCPPGSCDGADVLTKCQSDCPMPAGGGNDLACLTKSCNDTRFAVCDTKLTCPNSATPNCANISCSNSCMFNGKNVTGDGVCDDGDVYSSEFAQCAWGTDCTDCGPRVGAEPVGGPGDVCQYSLNCAGGTGTPDSAGAWCVNLNSLPGVARCMPDCSRNQKCADGFSCRTLMIPGDDGTSKPIEAGGYESSACLPDACL